MSGALYPYLMGSVGLEVRTGRSWRARDLDIHARVIRGVGGALTLTYL